MRNSHSERWRAGARRGYTLMEVLVAMSLLVLLGGGLVTLLNQGISMWHASENRGRIYEQARAVLESIADDLRSTAIRAHGGAGESWIRFVADRDPRGRQRLRFVRSISGETADSLLREGGSYLSTRSPATYDGFGDAAEAGRGLLAAPGGLMEILYVLDPRQGQHRIWRGIRSPVGGPGSLFIDESIEEARSLSGKEKSGPAEGAGDEPRLASVAVPVSEDVFFLGFRFWGPTTNTWKAVPPLRAPRPGEESGPVTDWTRSAEGGEDDVFPEMAEIVLVLRGWDSTFSSTLEEDLASDGKVLVLASPMTLSPDAEARLVLVDDEWIRIEGSEGRRLTVAVEGRGARSSLPAKHARGTPVEAGVTFRHVVEIPSNRRGVSEGRGGTNSKGGRR